VLKFEKNLQTTFYNQDEDLGEVEEDGEVMVNYYRVKAAEAIEFGMKYAEQG